MRARSRRTPERCCWARPVTLTPAVDPAPDVGRAEPRNPKWPRERSDRIFDNGRHKDERAVHSEQRPAEELKLQAEAAEGEEARYQPVFFRLGR
jgi:hypothetical protein